MKEQITIDSIISDSHRLKAEYKARKDLFTYKNVRHLNEIEHLEKGWTIKYITEFALPVSFYLRGEEYSAQIDAFIGCVQRRQQAVVNTFEQALYTDLVIDMIRNYAK